MWHRVRKLLVYVGAWTLIGLFFGSQAIMYAAYDNQPWPPRVMAALADWYVWAVLAPLILILGRRFPLTRARLKTSVPVLFVAGIVLTAIKIVLRVKLGQLFPSLPTMRIQGMVLSQFHINLATFWAILGIGAAFEYYGKYREREVRASQLESRLAQAQLQMLRAQLQPHFLFNTLHTISAFMQEGEIEAADRMITRLSDLLRLAIESVGEQEVPLRREMEFVQRYVDIQQIRFQDQLRVTLDVPDDTLDARVPSLILQPLVENAIRHGIGPRASGGTVVVRAARNDGSLRIEVLDDGVGLTAEAPSTAGAGLGLANTRERLEQLYGARHTFEVADQTAGGVRVKLVIPFRV